MPQNDKKLCPSHLISQEPSIIWSCFMALMCKRIIYPGVFLHFFQILIFKVVSRVKGQKMTQNDKKCLSHSISQEACMMWSWLLVHICNIMTSPDVCFIFSKLWFYGLLWGETKREKCAKMTKNVCLTPYLRNRIS